MLKLKNIRKVYKTVTENVEALKDINIEFRDSEFVAILGQSGCGKTTLLNIIGGLDRYTSGDLIIDHKSTKLYKDRDWDAYRNYSVGFVFQSYNLIGHQSILSNVELSLTISGYNKKDKRAKAIEALNKVGLGDKIHKRPNQLSGGQMQRVAIARAIVNNPDIILADEPTGALDSKTSVQIMDILKEIAKDKLVIMVTHNPKLAQDYATRIVELKDGVIMSDTDPIDTKDVELKCDKRRKTKLSFLTALGLSLNNLMTKKGRTILTAFAGAIGIIGIALILALSNGVNEYIADVEAETMGSYPITLQKETIDLSSFMSSVNESINSREEHDKENVYSIDTIKDELKADSLATAKNDLGKFKTYIEKNKEKIEENTSTIEYKYNISPVVLRLNNTNVVKVSPTYLSEVTDAQKGTIEAGMNNVNIMRTNIGMSAINTSSSSVWSEIISSENIMQTQYELLHGHYPTQANEVALIISENNEISDFILYTLGLMDYDKMLEMVNALNNNKEYASETAKVKYEDIVGKEYMVFAPSEMYKKVDDVWIDKSQDNEFLNSIISNGYKVKITAVLRATKESEISSGVAYTSKLTKYLISRNAQTDIVKEQLANKNINVFTGKEFEKKDDVKSVLNKNIKEENGVITASLREYNEDIKSILAELNDESQLTDSIIQEEPAKENDDTQVESEEKAKHTVKFVNYDGTIILEKELEEGTDLTQEEFGEISKPSQIPTVINIFIGWKSQDGKYYLSSELPKLEKDETYTALFYAYTIDMSKFQGLINPTISDAKKEEKDTPTIPDISNIPGDFNLEEYLKNNGGAQTTPGMGDMDFSNIGFSMEDYIASLGIGDLSEVASGGSTELSNDQLMVMINQMNGNIPTTYEEVLETLQYVKEEEPSSISLYPKDFDGKDAILNFIDEYNGQIEKQEDKVTYTDMIGTLTSSVKQIVNMISYVLIAFVSISLVVSSIMIAIITYISVLERTKEIGVLRALGASKKGVSKIFNAETFIEGFISGLIGIGVTLLLCIPVNRIVYKLTDVPNIAKLPVSAGIVLVLISIGLTVLAGIIPSKAASKKDPAVVLRSE